jgi:hypothetical protein
MNVPILHHYVPRFYLKRFADQQGRFWVWEKSTQKVFQTNPYGVAAEKHFYRVPDFIGTEVDPLFLERELAELEGKAAQITQTWVDSFDAMRPMERIPISPQDRGHMAAFISVQFLRTTEQRDILALFAAGTGHYRLGISPEERINLHAQMLHSGLVEEIAERIEKSIWLFARNGSETPLWTSDNPVSFKTGDSRMWLKGPGILSAGSYLVWPLTPSYVLYCKEPTHWVKLKNADCCLSPVELTSEMVEHENSGQVFMATRFVISSTNDFASADEFAKTIGTDVYASDNS